MTYSTCSLLWLSSELDICKNYWIHEVQSTINRFVQNVSEHSKHSAKLELIYGNYGDKYKSILYDFLSNFSLFYLN